MAVTIDDLLNDLKAKAITEVIESLRNNPDLVNGVNHENGCSLFMEVITRYKPNINLVMTIVSNPIFNLQYVNPNNNESNIKTLISIADPWFFNLVSDRQDILFDGKQLTFTTAKEILNEAKLELKDIKNSKLIAEQKLRIKNLEAIIDTLRKLTINYALANNKNHLLDQLQDASGNNSPQNSTHGIGLFFQNLKKLIPAPMKNTYTSV